MQFGSFVFNNNPEKITLSYKNNLISDFLPFSGDKNKKMGKRPRKVQCNGVFFSDNILDNQRQWDSLMESASLGESQPLIIPGFSPFNAYLEDMIINLSDDGKIMPYTLLFVEADDYD